MEFYAFIQLYQICSKRYFSFHLLILCIFLFLEFELQIDAHRAPLAAMALSSNGTYIATASEQGTIIRVHLVSEATKVKNSKRISFIKLKGSSSFYQIQVIFVDQHLGSQTYVYIYILHKNYCSIISFPDLQPLKQVVAVLLIDCTLLQVIWRSN